MDCSYTRYPLQQNAPPGGAVRGHPPGGFPGCRKGPRLPGPVRGVPAGPPLPLLEFGQGAATAAAGHPSHVWPPLAPPVPQPLPHLGQFKCL